jgi:hypothetical protein
VRRVPADRPIELERAVLYCQRAARTRIDRSTGAHPSTSAAAPVAALRREILDVKIADRQVPLSRSRGPVRTWHVRLTDGECAERHPCWGCSFESGAVALDRNVREHGRQGGRAKRTVGIVEHPAETEDSSGRQLDCVVAGPWNAAGDPEPVLADRAEGDVIVEVRGLNSLDERTGAGYNDH